MKSLDEHNAERHKALEGNWYDGPASDAHSLTDIECPRCGSAIKVNKKLMLQLRIPHYRGWCSEKSCRWKGDVAV